MLIGLEFILIIICTNNVIPMGANLTELAQRHLKNGFFCPISALNLWNAKPIPLGWLINPLNLPAVAGWSQFCYAGRCVSKTSPPVCPAIAGLRSRRRERGGGYLFSSPVAGLRGPALLVGIDKRR